MTRSLPIIKPRRLPAGGTIGIVTPASPPISDELLEKGISYLEKLGFRVKLGEFVRAKRGYLAGNDADRVYDLHAMFSDPEVDAIFAVRGGYGCGRFLHLIDYELIKRNAKIFVGYSDITALHCALYHRTGLITFTGPMVAADFGSGIDPQTDSYFWSLIMDGATGLRATFNDSIDGFFNVKRGFTGHVLGGNLSVLCSLIGSAYIPDFNGCVLALEEIGEAPYRIDRMLNQLKMSGVFDRLSGVLLGQFTDCIQEDDKPTLTLDEVFTDYFSSVGYCVLKNIPFGHEKRKITLPMGGFIRYDPDEKSLTIVESPVV
jgi:muramoyltetrapeptide carboxypeptidase